MDIGRLLIKVVYETVQGICQSLLHSAAAAAAVKHCGEAPSSGGKLTLLSVEGRKQGYQIIIGISIFFFLPFFSSYSIIRLSYKSGEEVFHSLSHLSLFLRIRSLGKIVIIRRPKIHECDVI